MEQILTPEVAPKTDAEYQAEIDFLIADSKRMTKENQADRERGEQARLRTQANLDAIRQLIGGGFGVAKTG